MSGTPARTDEMARLCAENQVLRGEITELRHEVADLRRRLFAMSRAMVLANTFIDMGNWHDACNLLREHIRLCIPSEIVREVTTFLAALQ